MIKIQQQSADVSTPTFWHFIPPAMVAILMVGTITCLFIWTESRRDHWLFWALAALLAAARLTEAFSARPVFAKILAQFHLDEEAAE